jgi:hypothetical protein
MTDTQQDAFDPADHNIDDVLKHLEAHPDQVEAVLAAERAGKDRATLVTRLTGDQDVPEGSDQDAPEGPGEPAPGDEPEPRRESKAGTYILEAGDTPSRVGKLLYGRGSLGGALVRANPGVKWRAGVEIVLPDPG